MSAQAQFSDAPSGHRLSDHTIKIAYLIDFFGAGGGTENQLAMLINHLDRSRFTPYLYTLRSVALDNKLTVSCPVTQLDVTSLASMNGWRGIRRLANELTQKQIDILQLFFIDSNILGVISGKLAHVPNIVISRRDMGWWYGQKRRHVTNLLNRSADYCIANADAIKEVVVAHETIRPEQIEVIYNGIPEVKPSGDGALTRATLGIPEPVPVVGIVANLKPIKRIDRFVRVAAKVTHPDTHFLIVGYGDQKEELQQLAVSLGLGDRAHFYYTADRIADIMRMMTIGVLTSESEGLSNVLVEYAFSGLPAVAFDTGGNNEAIEQEKTGLLIPPYDEDAMAKAIDSLLTDGAKAKRMGEAAHTRAKERFSVEQMVRSTERFYERIVDESRNGKR